MFAYLYVSEGCNIWQIIILLLGSHVQSFVVFIKESQVTALKKVFSLENICWSQKTILSWMNQRAGPKECISTGLCVQLFFFPPRNFNDESPLGIRRILSQSTDSLNMRNRTLSVESLIDEGEMGMSGWASMKLHTRNSACVYMHTQRYSSMFPSENKSSRRLKYCVAKTGFE